MSLTNIIRKALFSRGRRILPRLPTTPHSAASSALMSNARLQANSPAANQSLLNEIGLSVFPVSRASQKQIASVPTTPHPAASAAPVSSSPPAPTGFSCERPDVHNDAVLQKAESGTGNPTIQKSGRIMNSAELHVAMAATTPKAEDEIARHAIARPADLAPQSGVSRARYTLAPHHSGSPAQDSRIPSVSDVFYAGRIDEDLSSAQGERRDPNLQLFLAEWTSEEDVLDLLECIPDIEALFEVISGALGNELRYAVV